MPSVPIAAFIAGSLLSLLLPVGLLIALVVWYYLFSVRVPETPTKAERHPDPGAATPAPTVSEALPPEPGV